MPPDDELDSLYAAPLEEFTPKRNELAKSLRAEGDAKAADAVKALRKPSRPAWLVNQLARRRPGEVKRLLQAGAELRELQEKMLAGSADRDALREAAANEQQLVEGLLRRARAIGAEHGVSAQVLDRVGETLQAVASDPDLAETVRRGRLERERRASSLGLVGSAAAPARPSKPRDGAAAKREAAEREHHREEAKRRRRAERRFEAAERSLARAQAALERAERETEGRRKKVELAEDEAAAARAELNEAG